MNTIFIELLQVAVGKRQRLSRTPETEEWEALYDMAKKQALVGVAFHAVRQLPEEQLPTGYRLRQWAAKAAKIEEMNERVTRGCRALTELFAKGHYRTCVLKGQSNVLAYSKEMRGLRNPGDIDLWVWQEREDGTKYLDKKRLVRALWRMQGKRTDVAVHHAECDILPKTDVEIHFEPSFSLNMLTDHRMQRYWREYRDCTVMTEGGYNRPTVAFDLVFQMSHIFRHLLLEGIGLRQLMDYYFLLMRFHEEGGDKVAVMRDIRRLQMRKICGAVMWVMKEVFDMDGDWLLCEPQERYGRELLKEVFSGGNFGHHYEDRAKAVKGEDGKETTESKWEGNWQTILRGMRFMSSYPQECLWVPFLCIRASVVRNWWRRLF